MSCSHRKCVSFVFKQGFTNHTFVAGAKGREEAGATGTLGSACLTEGLACAKTLRQKETWLIPYTIGFCLGNFYYPFLIFSSMRRDIHDQNISNFSIIHFCTVGITYLISGFGRRNTQPRPFPFKTLEASCPYRAHVCSALRSGSTNRSTALMLFSVSLTPRLFLQFCSNLVEFLRGPGNTFFHILTQNQLRNMKIKEKTTSTLFLIKLIL